MGIEDKIELLIQESDRDPGLDLNNSQEKLRMIAAAKKHAEQQEDAGPNILDQPELTPNPHLSPAELLQQVTESKALEEDSSHSGTKLEKGASMGNWRRKFLAHTLNQQRKQGPKGREMAKEILKTETFVKK